MAKKTSTARRRTSNKRERAPLGFPGGNPLEPFRLQPGRTPVDAPSDRVRGASQRGDGYNAT